MRNEKRYFYYWNRFDPVLTQFTTELMGTSGFVTSKLTAQLFLVSIVVHVYMLNTLVYVWVYKRADACLCVWRPTVLSCGAFRVTVNEHEVWHVNMKSNDVFTASVTYTIFWTSNAFHKLNRTYVQNRFGFAFLQEQFDRNYILLFFIHIDAKLLFISRLYWSWSCSWSVSRCEYWRSLLVEPKTFRLEQ